MGSLIHGNYRESTQTGASLLGHTTGFRLRAREPAIIELRIYNNSQDGPHQVQAQTTEQTQKVPGTSLPPPQTGETEHLQALHLQAGQDRRPPGQTVQSSSYQQHFEEFRETARVPSASRGVRGGR